MLRVNPAFIFEKGEPKRSPNLVWCLAVMAACSLLWAGCNTLPQSAAASSRGLQQPAPGISIQTALPGAAIGNSYHAVLSVSGGLAPYHFAVGPGELPPGLALNPQTGSISGTPTQTGSFTFTIVVTGESAGIPRMLTSGASDETFGASGSRSYTVTVSPSGSSVQVQISPADPSVITGGKVQFTAVVSNSSNSAVTWSASAGSISANGLFTAPTGTGAKPVTVTASSAAQTTAQGSTAVTITSAAFTITTSSVPFAVESTPYSAVLTATGGQPPYNWSIVSGSLPAGLQLGASTGTLSGSATQAGTFTFTVQGTDAASQTVKQSLSLVVSNSAQTCGPPAYNCSRTDLNIVQVSTPPSVGSLVGANTIVTDPNFGNRIVRITDSNTNPTATAKDVTYVTTSSGSADENLWNTDSTLFIVQDTGAEAYPFAFTPSTLQAARMYVSSFPATNGFTLSDTGIWSRVNPNVLYTYSGTAINEYDFTDRTNAPSPQPVYDFTSSRNCLPAGFTETWSAKGGVNSDDTVFAAGYSNRGDQGTGIYAVVYKVGSGCSILNTQTGQVGGDWGVKGTINIPDRWTVHNVKVSKDGNWLIISIQNCTSSSCSTGPYFWQIGTTNVSSCADGGMCSGHFTEGYSHWVNNNNSPLSNQVIRSFAESNHPAALTSRFPVGITTPFDQHQSWNNVDPDDTLPFLSATWSTVKPFPAPWYNEIIAVAADGSGKTWRFAHSFITARSQRFSTEYAIGTVSQDGRFFIFSSDWMGGLGSESGAKTCTIGSNCRGDVFVVELR